MSKFALGGAMGFALGAGLMMAPAGREIRRDVRHAMGKMRRWIRNM